MDKSSKIDTYIKNGKITTSNNNSPSSEKYNCWYEVEMWTDKFLEAKILRQRTVTVFGTPRSVRPPFQEFCAVSRYYGSAKIIPSIYRAEEMFPSSEGIPQSWKITNIQIYAWVHVDLIIKIIKKKKEKL